MIDRIREIVAGFMGIRVSDIVDDKSFLELGMDSLTLLKIVIKIEEEYNISIGNDEIVEIKNLIDILSLAEKKFFN
jgi:acyl carrier protein